MSPISGGPSSRVPRPIWWVITFIPNRLALNRKIKIVGFIRGILLLFLFLFSGARFSIPKKEQSKKKKADHPSSALIIITLRLRSIATPIGERGGSFLRLWMERNRSVSRRMELPPRKVGVLRLSAGREFFQGCKRAIAMKGNLAISTAHQSSTREKISFFFSVHKLIFLLTFVLPTPNYVYFTDRTH